MAGVFAIFGPSMPAMRGVQFVVGALGCVLVFWIGRAVFGTPVGIIAGIMAGLCPIGIFYDGKLVRASLAAETNLVLLATLLLAHRFRRTGWWILSGLCFGLCLLVRPNIALFGPLLFFWIWVTFRKDGGYPVFRKIAAVLAGTVAVIALLVVRNVAADAPPLSIDAQGPYVFYIGNAADAEGVGYVLPDSYHDAPKDRLIQEAVTSALQNPGAFLRLYARKAVGILNGYEYPNNMNFYMFQRFSWILKNPLLGLALLLPLGLLGAVLSVSRSRESLLLSLFLVSGLFSVLIFYVISRFRYPIVPLLYIFSAYSVVWVADAIKRRAYSKWVPAVAAVFILFFAAIPRPPGDNYIRAVDFFNLGLAMASQGRLSEAEENYREAIRLNPDYAEAHLNIGIFCMGKGRSKEAIHHYREAIRSAPDLAEAHFNYAILLEMARQFDQAIHEYRETLRARPSFIRAHINLGFLLAELGRTGEAIDHSRRALRLNPERPKVHHHLGLLLSARGDVIGAIRHFRKALGLAPGFAMAHNNLGAMLMKTGEVQAAVGHFREAIRLQPDLDVAHKNLHAALRSGGR
jgi:tetratricopeptide (TPR) repeat protein